MKKLLILFLFPLFIYAKFNKDGPKIKDLELWEDKMPFEEIDGYTLMSSTELIDEITKILGPKKIKEFLKVSNQSSVEGGSKDGFITFNLCHGYCGIHNFQVYINTKTKKTYICEMINDEKFQLIWYGRSKIEFNNLTEDNMIYCRFTYPAGKTGTNWEEFLSAIPKEIF